jgi:hypothetical protein
MPMSAGARRGIREEDRRCIMNRRHRVAAFAVAATLAGLAMPAIASSAGSQIYTDPLGDTTGPFDIAQVSVANDDAGQLAFTDHATERADAAREHGDGHPPRH